MPQCCATGPGYATPLDAYINGPRESLCYVQVTSADHQRPDYVATVRQRCTTALRRCRAAHRKTVSPYARSLWPPSQVDLDPSSPTYSTVISRLSMPSLGDELHHSGWCALSHRCHMSIIALAYRNACSSCFGNPNASRKFLILVRHLTASRGMGQSVS